MMPAVQGDRPISDFAVWLALEQASCPYEGASREPLNEVRRWSGARRYRGAALRRRGGGERRPPPPRDARRPVVSRAHGLPRLLQGPLRPGDGLGVSAAHRTSLGQALSGGFRFAE